MMTTRLKQILARTGRVGLAPLIAATAGLAIASPAQAQYYDNGYYDNGYYDDDAMEWEPETGYHEEEWYDPTDWFDDDFGYGGVDYEETGWDDDYYYDSGYDYGYNDNYGYDDTYRYDDRGDFYTDENDPMDYDYWDSRYDSDYGNTGYYDDNYSDWDYYTDEDDPADYDYWDSRRDYDYNRNQRNNWNQRDRMNNNRYDLRSGGFETRNNTDWNRRNQRSGNQAGWTGGDRQNQSRYDRSRTNESRMDQNRMDQSRMNQGRMDRMSQNRYDRNRSMQSSQARIQNAELRGELEGWQRKSLQGQRDAHTIVRMRLENGRSAMVNLGPNVSLSRLDLDQGDRVAVKGKTGSIDGKQVLMAQAIRSGDKVVRMNNWDPKTSSGSANKSADKSDNPARVFGQLDGWQRTNLQGQPDAHTLVRLRLQDGSSAIVNLGPNVDVSRLNLSQGDRIAVLGQPGSINGENVLLAQVIRAGDRTLRMDNWTPSSGLRAGTERQASGNR